MCTLYADNVRQKFSIVGNWDIAFGDFTSGIAQVRPTNISDLDLPIGYRVLSTTVYAVVSTVLLTSLRMLKVMISSPNDTDIRFGENTEVTTINSQNGIYWYPNSLIMHTFPFLSSGLAARDYFVSTHDQVFTKDQGSTLDLVADAYTVSGAAITQGVIDIWVLMECETL